jgi:hypothetical protein
VSFVRFLEESIEQNLKPLITYRLALKVKKRTKCWKNVLLKNVCVNAKYANKESLVLDKYYLTK